MMNRIFARGLLGALALTTQANAAVITGTTVSNFSTQFDFAGIDRKASYLVSGAGFNATPGAYSNVADGTMWLTAPSDAAPSITFDLGHLYNLTSARIWNYNESSGDPATFTARGVKNVTISISSDNITFASLGNFVLTQAPGSNTVDFSQIQALSGTAEFIRFANLTSFTPGNGFVGLSQVVFNGTAIEPSSVPEPATLTLLGCAMAAIFGTRRKSNLA